MWTVLLAAALAADPAEFEAQTLDGQSVVGQLAALDAGQLTLETSAGPTKIAVSTLAVLTRKPAPASEERKAKLWVELVDGSGLAGREYAARGGTAEITLLTGAPIEVPTKAIRSVHFGSTVDRDPKLAKQWSEIVETKTSGDLLVVRKNGALDYLEGVQGDVDPEVCNFELDKETIPVKRPKVEGIVYFHPAAAELPESVGQLSASDGSRLNVRTARLADGTVRLATPSGVALSVPLEVVTRVDFSSGKIAYLSDLEPESATFVPYLGFAEEPPALREFYRYRRDVGFEQNPLRLDGKLYRKGLSLQSRTLLTYKLPGKFRVFKTVIGIDDAVRETGDVRVEIKADGKTLWQGEVRGADPARELELEIPGVRRLEIIADYGDGMDIGDRLDLCEARVTK